MVATAGKPNNSRKQTSTGNACTKNHGVKTRRCQWTLQWIWILKEKYLLIEHGHGDYLEHSDGDDDDDDDEGDDDDNDTLSLSHHTSPPAVSIRIELRILLDSFVTRS